MWKHLTAVRKLERIGPRGGSVQSGPAPVTKRQALKRAALFDRLNGKKMRWRLTWTPGAVVVLGVLAALIGGGVTVGLTLLLLEVL